MNLPVEGYFGSFQFGTLMNNAAINTLVKLFMYICFHFSWVSITGVVAGSFGKGTFNFVGNCQTAFQNDVLYSHQ